MVSLKSELLTSPNHAGLSSIWYHIFIFLRLGTAVLQKYPVGGRQILPRSISQPPTPFNVLMIPSVAFLNANKKIMLPAMIAIPRGLPAVVNSAVEKLLTGCLMIPTQV